MSERVGFIQRIRFEDKVLEMIAKCNEAFAVGDRKFQDSCVSALHSLLYAIPEVKGLTDLEDEIVLLETKAKKDYDEKMIVYNKKCKAAMCPDVIDKPVLKFNTNLIDLKYREILNCLAKNGLTLTSKNITHL